MGRWLLVVLVASIFAIVGGKELFGRPRPYVFDAVQIVSLAPASGNGFPSGHVGGSLAIWGFVALWFHRRWSYVLLAVYIVGMAWSRLYTGNHYLQDLLGGVLIGGGLAYAIYTYRPLISGGWNRLHIVTQSLLIVAAAITVATLLRGDEDGWTLAGITLGGGLGLLFEARYADFGVSGRWVQRGLRYIIGIVATLVVFYVLDAIFEGLRPAALWRVLRYGVVSALILGLYPIVMIHTNLASRDPTS